MNKKMIMMEAKLFDCLPESMVQMNEIIAWEQSRSHKFQVIALRVKNTRIG